TTDDVAEFAHALRKPAEISISCRLRTTNKIGDQRLPGGHLRPRRDRPRRRAGEQCDDLAATDHSITSSTLASSCGGTSRFNALAVCKLMANSNLVGCTTGNSAGLAPFRMRPTFGEQLRQAVVSAVEPMILDRDILALLVARFL